jgi:uncharacterized protein with ATP-grasp and redox domains
MKLEIDCIPCITKQALELAKMTTNDDKIQKKILKECVKLISGFENFEYSPVMAREINKIVKRLNVNIGDYVFRCLK